MKTRIIHTRLWTDAWFKKLSRASKLVFVYLISNQFIGLTGMFEINDEQICFDAGLTLAELEEAKKQLVGKANFFNGWVKIANCERYQTFKGSKNEIAIEKELSFIPLEVRDTLSIGYAYPMHSLSNHKSEIINKKEGGVGETKEPKINKSSLDSLTDDFCVDVAKNYNVSIKFVQTKKNDLILYCRSTGKSYKDYQATLQAWVRKDRDDK